MDIDPECGVFYSLKSGVVLCRLISVLNPAEDIPAPNDSTLTYKQVCATRRLQRGVGEHSELLRTRFELHAGYRLEYNCWVSKG